MASNALIVAHNNVFNKSILQEDAYFFDISEGVSKYITLIKKDNRIKYLKHNKKKIQTKYSWKSINEEYLNLFMEVNR